ncbi:hypothetical protein PSACC_00546 [Paramicrosporidium saccamoebae]|uniref:Uncharacterized protein n=1 Tax=Paramicrosporidium saccamoebae TaxID=1246581 RepID=A0A2H9TPH3_9FUNG|nr:hypothetical protein PSACC_00546 [Paramicrosporidium saccamoebae]
MMPYMSYIPVLGQAVINLSQWTIQDWPVLAILHATFAAWNFRKNADLAKLSPLEALLATWILSFGGTTISFLPLAMYYLPGDFLFKGLEISSPITYPVLALADLVSKTISITTNGVDAVRFHSSGRLGLQNSAFAAIFCGFISGCGGGVLGNLVELNKGSSWTLKTPSQIHSPNASLLMSLFGACIYWSTTYLNKIYPSTIDIHLDRTASIGLTFLSIASIWLFSSFSNATKSNVNKAKPRVRKAGRKIE